MNDYAYQIMGALENAGGKCLGLRVKVCNIDHLESVDVPAEVFDSETIKFLEFRLKVTPSISIQTLPYKIQNRIRAPLGRWLDRWVLEHFYGHTSNTKSTNS